MNKLTLNRIKNDTKDREIKYRRCKDEIDNIKNINQNLENQNNEKNIQIGKINKFFDKLKKIYYLK